ncbi:MAG: tripartite tricarboxylate transporter TctB family protein [Synergistaceae bacterium]
MNPEVIVGTFSAVFSIVYTIAALRLPDAAIGSPMAPKYFPLVVGLMAVALSLGLIIKSLRTGDVSKKSKTPDQGYWILIVGLIISCLVYAALLERIGFLISTPLFLGAMLFIVNGIRGWKANILTAVGFSFGVWYIFEKIFMITLP